MSLDPLAVKYAAWSSYHYAANNPINVSDPTGMEWSESNQDLANRFGVFGNGEKLDDWVDNGDGTYTAEAGDSAASLAKDAGISNSYANALVENQLGPNYIGVDGGLKSNIEIGDVVNLNENGPINSLSEFVGNLDAAFTFTGGVGLNFTEINRYGNTGSRFNAKLFNSNYFKLRGGFGSKAVNIIKYGGPLLTAGSIAYSLTSDQSASWKAVDTGFSLVGLFGGVPGAFISVGYGLSVKPMVKAATEPTPKALRSMYEHQVKYCNKKSCN